MKTIFEPVALGRLQLKNRLIRSATVAMGGGQDGIIAPFLKVIDEKLAMGGVGLIITGMMGVGHNSCAYPGMIKTYDSTFETKFKEIADTVHNHDCKVVVQLCHSGISAGVLEEGSQPWRPSAFEIFPGLFTREMTKADIRRVCTDFGNAARHCKNAGANGVQIHAAHGFLLNQFLSPYYNKRTDEYGGTLENRARMIVEVYESIRQAVGEQFPILMKMNYSDLVDGGMTGEECIKVCNILKPLGLDAVEISSELSVDAGSAPTRRPVSDKEGCYTKGALHVQIPVISVGGYRSTETIERVLNEGNIAAISMSRPLICEPDLPTKWTMGETTKAKCVSCNRCFGGTYECKVFS